MQPYPTILLPAMPPPSLVSPRSSRASMAILVLSLSVAACRDPKVISYSVPKESAAGLPATKPVAGVVAAPASEMSAPTLPTNAPGAPTNDAHGLQTAAGAGLTWTAPADWEKKTGSAMRKATYVVKGDGGAVADLAVSAFPGDVGGEVANVNRWRGQVGLPPVGDAEALASVQRIEANGLQIGVVDIFDPANRSTRLLGAWVPHDGGTWFFKLLGPDAVVARAQPAFLEFLKSVKPATAARP